MANTNAKMPRFCSRVNEPLVGFLSLPSLVKLFGILRGMDWWLPGPAGSKLPNIFKKFSTWQAETSVTRFVENIWPNIFLKSLSIFYG